MANCPKCNYKLKLTDWKPECPKCGVNMLYYGMEDRLRAEADQAEYQHAKLQPRIDRIKAAIYGSKLSIARLIACVLPVFMTLVPILYIRLSGPYIDRGVSFNLIGLITFFTNYFDLDSIKTLLTSTGYSGTTIFFTVTTLTFVLITLIALIYFLLQALSCSGKWFRRNIIFAVIQIVLSIACMTASILFSAELNKTMHVYARSVFMPGLILIIAAYAAVVFINIKYKKDNIQVKYTDVSELLLPYDQRPSVLAARQAAEKEKDQSSDQTSIVTGDTTETTIGDGA